MTRPVRIHYDLCVAKPESPGHLAQEGSSRGSLDTGNPFKERHLPLRIAATLLHVRVVGKSLDGSDLRCMHATLNDVARALSMVSPIYYEDPASGLPVQIPASTLIGATFTGGGEIVVAADGTQYRNLTVRRADIEIAGEILCASTSLQKRWIDRQAT